MTSLTVSGVLRLFTKDSDDPADEIRISETIPLAQREYFDRGVLIREFPADHAYVKCKAGITVSAPKGIFGQVLSAKADEEIELAANTTGNQ
jgi:hypothetical protein